MELGTIYVFTCCAAREAIWGKTKRSGGEDALHLDAYACGVGIMIKRTSRAEFSDLLEKLSKSPLASI